MKSSLNRIGDTCDVRRCNASTEIQRCFNLKLLSVQILINGLVSGLAIALLAMAFQVVYLPTRVFFIALAGVYSLVPYVVLACREWGMPWVISVGGAAIVGSAVSVLCEKLNHARLTRRGASEGAHLISSLGIYIASVQIVAMIWGNQTKTLRTGLDSVTRWADLVITGSQWITAMTAVLLLGVFWGVLYRSNLGLRLRALADNPTMFALFGYNIDLHRLFAFALCGIFAASSSFVTAYDIGFTPHSGLHAVLLAVVAVIIGGRDSFVGPVVGALLLGLLRAQVVWHFSARWQEAATFALLAVFLLLRPQGLLGGKSRIEAA